MTPQQLEILAETLANEQPLPPDQYAELADVFRAWCSGESLAAAFGITDSAQERIQRRNERLCKYADELLTGSRAAKARAIFRDIKAIHQGRRYKNEILCAINKIYPLPETKRMIEIILKKGCL